MSLHREDNFGRHIVKEAIRHDISRLGQDKKHLVGRGKTNTTFDGDFDTRSLI